jgi:hypothetical protein
VGESVLKKFKFKREKYVKNLFVVTDILKQFQLIEFETFTTFINCLQNNLIKISDRCELMFPITNENELELLENLFSEPEVTKYRNINLLVTPDYYKFILKNENIWKYNFKITLTDFPILYDDVNFGQQVENNPKIKEWINKNPLIINVKLNSDNLPDKIQEIVKLTSYTGHKWYDLKFDYSSFEDIKISDIPKYEFWLNHLYIWEYQQKEFSIDIKKSFNIYKQIFVSSDIKLYLDNIDRYLILDLSKNSDNTGETINIKELNILRQYIDLCTKHLYLPENFNKILINYSDNIKIMGNINEIPLITKLLGGLL